MQHLLRLTCKNFAKLYSAEKLFHSQTPVFLPFYHEVSNTQLPYIKNYPYRNKEQFILELDEILKYFTPITLEEIYKNPNPQKPVFHLTFDDGLRRNIELVAPILLQKGIPATFFINSGFVDNKDLFHRYKASLILNEFRNNPDSEVESLLKQNGLDLNNILTTHFSQRDILDQVAELLEFDFTKFLTKEKPYLTTEQVKQLNEQGFTIGGHSHKHPEFWLISEKKQLKHVQKSMKWIKKNVPQKIKAFSFPFTDNGVTKSFLQKLHTNNICDISFGTAGLKYDSTPLHLQRYPVEQKGDFQENLKAEFVYFKLRKLLGKATVIH